MTTFEELKVRARSWTEPLASDAPGGAQARFDPRYETAAREVAKLESPTAAGPVDWRLVVALNGELLQMVCKDLRLAAQLAFGLFVLEELDGLTTGVVLLCELIERYWPSLQPELPRLRARANAVAWFVDKASRAIEARSGDEALTVERLRVAVTRLGELVSEKFGTDAPAMRPLAEALDRLELSQAAMAPPSPTAETGPAAPISPTKPAAAKASPESPAPPPLVPVPAAAPTIDSGADPVAALREFGTALASAAGVLRRALPEGQLAYRALRSGLWLHLAAPPPSNAGKTQVPAPPEPLRASFARMAQSGKWSELVEEAEGALIQHRLWLDPHRISAQALAALGPAYGPARQELVAELAAFLRRPGGFGGLCELAFADGSPLADSETRAWLAAEGVLSPPARGSSPSGSELDVAMCAEVRKLAGEGKLGDAVALLHGVGAEGSSGSARFRARLELGRLLLAGGQPKVARGIFTGLDDELRLHGIEDWEPALAADTLESHLECLRALALAGEIVSEDTSLIYNRLCRLDPVAAMRIGVKT